MKLCPFALSLCTLSVAAVALFAAQDKQGEDEGMPPMATPTEQHKLLERQAGTWDATVAMEGMPESKAVYTAKLDHGGLWLVAEYRGDFMGPFSGTEVKGYDPAKKKYVSIWVDSWIDHIMPFEGDFDAKTQTLSMWTDGHDMTGKPIRERHDTKFIDADNWVFTMNHPQADGSYAPVMTITYKRRK